MTAWVEVRRVSKEYPTKRGWGDALRAPFGGPTRRALHEVDLGFAAGEVVAIVGPNGSGKTTLLRLLSGLVTPDSGEVRVDGRAPGPAAAHLVGVAASGDRGFHERLDVAENLRFFGALYGLHGAEFDARLAEVAARLGAAELLDRPYRFLSSGQRATVAMLRALLARPRLLLLDEITRALDPGAAGNLRRHIAELAGNDGTTVVLASHDLHEVEAVASRVVLLVDGTVRADGPWTEVRGVAERTFFTAPT